MTNTPLTVIDANGTSVTVLSDDYGLGFGNAAGTSTQLLGIDNSDTVTFASAISTLPAGDFLFVTSAVKQDRFEIGQAIAINKDLFRKCFPNTSGSTIAFKRVYGSLKVTESKANIDAQLVDSSGGTSAQMPANTLKGNNTGATANAADLTVAQVKTMLDVPYGAESGTSIDPTSKKVRFGGQLIVDTEIDANTKKFNVVNINTMSLKSANLNGNNCEIYTTAFQISLNKQSGGQNIGVNIGSGGINLAFGAGNPSLQIGSDFVAAKDLPQKTTETEVVFIDSSTGKLAKGTPIGGSSLTEYGVAVSGGSGGITARLYGTSGITTTRVAADTYRFNIPASGYLQSWDLYLPIADNAVAGFKFEFVYASPTFNTNFQTIKPFSIQMMTDTGNIYVNRAAPAATDFANTPTIPTSGTLQHVVSVPSALQGVVLKVCGKI